MLNERVRSLTLETPDLSIEETMKLLRELQAVRTRTFGGPEIDQVASDIPPKQSAASVKKNVAPCPAPSDSNIHQAASHFRLRFLLAPKGPDNTYTLTNFEGKARKTVGIVSSNADLAPHVGHKIELTGIAVPAKEAAAHYMRADSD